MPDGRVYGLVMMAAVCLAACGASPESTAAALPSAAVAARVDLPSPSVPPPPIAATPSPVVPSAAPAPVVVPAATPPRAPSRPVPPAARPAPPRLPWVAVPRLGLRVNLVDYHDCHGTLPIPRTAGIRLDCGPPVVTTVMAHNPGLFTPLLGAHVGDTVDYFDGTTTQAFTITSITRDSPEAAVAPVADGSHRHLVMATCARPDASAFWVFVAIPV